MIRPGEGIASGTVLLGKYRIDEAIGRGGMGLVYRAHHLALDEQVAIKILREEVALDEEAVQRFHREAQAAVRLKSEHVARISDVGTFEDGTPYIVMEFLAGADLGSIVDTNGPMPIGAAIDLMLQACDALAEAHSINIVHRDVKPSNLFVTTRPDGALMVKILDFGISKSTQGQDLSLTQTASVLGTPAYMSPEQMRSARRVDGRTDIWSLGTVLYELVEGRRPFMAETFSEMCVMAAADPHEPMIRAPQLERIVGICLAKTPESRYPSIAELARDLAPFASDLQRAQYYVQRIHRVLNRPLDGGVPMTPRPGELSGPTRAASPVQLVNPFAGMGAYSAAQSLEMPHVPSAPVTLSTVRDAKQRSRMPFVVAIALITSAVVIAIIVATGSPSSSAAKTAADDVETASGSSLAADPVVGSASAAAGSSEVVAGSARGSDAGSGAGSAGSASAGSAVIVKAGSGSGSAKKVTTPVKRGSGATAGGTTKRGSADATKKGSAAGSATVPPKKQCNPFESARPCPKE